MGVKKPKVEFDYSKLRGRIVEKCGTLEAFSNEVNISLTALSKKLNNKMEITRDNIISWSEVLDIPQEDFGVFYFVKKLNDV